MSLFNYAELLRERGGYSRISEAPANIIAAAFVASPASVHRLNSPRMVPGVHVIQPFAETAIRHQDINVVRKIPLNCFEASSAFVAGH